MNCQECNEIWWLDSINDEEVHTKKSLIDSKNLTKSKPAIGAEGERASRVGVAMKK